MPKFVTPPPARTETKPQRGRRRLVRSTQQRVGHRDVMTGWAGKLCKETRVVTDEWGRVIWDPAAVVRDPDDPQVIDRRHAGTLAVSYFAARLDKRGYTLHDAAWIHHTKELAGRWVIKYVPKQHPCYPPVAFAPRILEAANTRLVQEAIQDLPDLHIY